MTKTQVHATECPLCGCYLPTLGHLLSEQAAASGTDRGAVDACITARYPQKAASDGR